MAKKKPSKSLSKSSKTSLSKSDKHLAKTKKEVLEKGSKHVKPLALARRKVLRLTAGILGAVVVIFLIVIGLLIYLAKSDSAVVYRVSQVIPYPAARVNRDFVSYADYLFEVRYRKNIYENPSGPASASQQPVDFADPENADLLKDIQQSSLRRAKMKAIIRQLAAEHDVSVSKEELDNALNDLVERQGGEDKFRDAIEDFYGWNIDDFKRELRLQLLQQKLELIILPPANAKARQQAENVLARAKGDVNFAKLARQVSEDPGSKDQGGNLGFVGQDTPYVQEFKDAALALKEGEISDVVVTQFGFHIIKATDTKDGQVKVSHILITFDKELDAVLSEQLNQAETSDYIKLPEAQTQTQVE